MAADALGPKRMAEELRHVLSDKHLRGSFTRSIVDAHQIAEDRYNDSVDLAECSLSRYQYYHAKSGLIVPFFVVLTCGYTGLVCNYILKMNGGNGVILAFDMIRRTFSFRTDRDDIDLSELARSLGGGGHRQAAGFTSEQLSNIVLQSTERFGTELSKHLNAAFAGKLV
jgi:nanoRNase/pAp phosphatase (c-di-AMP/oligoRNAs hydrolase)